MTQVEVKTKYKIELTEIKYIGHILCAKGLKQNQEKVRAITEMPQSEEKSALMIYRGMMQYLSKFIPNMCKVSYPLIKLLEEDAIWHWGSQKQQCFESLKKLVSNAPVLKFFCVNKPITLSVDAGSGGLGAVLVSGGRPVVYCSRALSETQLRYAQIENELLAVLYGCEPFREYLYGKCVHMGSDHKPPEAEGLHIAPPRLGCL